MTDHDYSPTIKSSADKLTRSGGKIADTGRNLYRLPSGTPSPGQAPAPVAVGGPQGGGTTVYRGILLANWIIPLLRFASNHGWNGAPTSGYRSVPQQREACRHVCGNPEGCPGRCAKPGTSNHQFYVYPRGAVDVTDPAGFERAMNRYPGGPPLVNHLPADPVHFSHSGH